MGLCNLPAEVLRLHENKFKIGNNKVELHYTCERFKCLKLPLMCGVLEECSVLKCF